jgi:exportin-2 (importin alpha re-exporter)
MVTPFQQGVTTVNPLVNIVQFFSEYVAQDLQAVSGSVHPVLEVDSIRFLYTFRSQVCAHILSSSINTYVANS